MKRVIAFSVAVILALFLPFSVSALEIIPQMFTVEIDKYNAYIQENEDLPRNFVTYQALSAFGSFRSFCTYETPKLMQHYHYTFDVQEDINIIIYVDSSKRMDKNLETVGMSQIINDMSYIKEPKDCVIKSGGFIYEYYDCGQENGKLASVSWVIGNVTFTIGCSEHEFHNLSPDSLLGRILSDSRIDHRIAINQIKFNIICEWLRNSLDIVMIVFVILIVILAASIVVWRRYKRRRLRSGDEFIQAMDVSKEID